MRGLGRAEVLENVSGEKGGTQVSPVIEHRREIRRANNLDDRLFLLSPVGADRNLKLDFLIKRKMEVCK